MADIATINVVDGVATAELDDATGFHAGAYAYLFGCGAGVDGPRQLTAVNGNEISFPVSIADTTTALEPAAGTADIAVTWITDEDTETFIGVTPAGEADAAYLAAVTDAANEWAYRRRYAAGYADAPTVVPSSPVKAGTTMMAGSLYRERGSIDTFASFEAMGTAQPIGNMGQILRLLGINRPAVA